MLSCGNEESIDTQIIGDQVQAAPDNPHIPNYTVNNFRIKEWSDTTHNIVVWVSFEKNGTQTVSKKITIPK